ncbi:phage protein [Escherichia coli]|uniref:Phage protein n=1 Tax=Escherichia coli TaxID=562 RepID=A0A376W722_ECOLX|nr:phage protein [Escherichia coli]
MSTHKNERRGNPPFQFRLDPDLREKMEKAQQQDGDDSLAAWIKANNPQRITATRHRTQRIKNYQRRGVRYSGALLLQAHTMTNGRINRKKHHLHEKDDAERKSMNQNDSRRVLLPLRSTLKNTHPKERASQLWQRTEPD